MSNCHCCWLFTRPDHKNLLKISCALFTGCRNAAGTGLEASFLMAKLHSARKYWETCWEEISLTVLLSFGPWMLHSQPIRQEWKACYGSKQHFSTLRFLLRLFVWLWTYQGIWRSEDTLKGSVLSYHVCPGSRSGHQAWWQATFFPQVISLA